MSDMSSFKLAIVGDRKVIVGGIGKLFYESGFPIHISVDIAKDKGYEVSLLHIADELYKNGWKKRAIINTLKQDFEWCEQSISDFIDAGMSGELREGMPLIGQEWIYSKNGYEAQREILFQSLFGYESKEAMVNKSKRKGDLYTTMKIIHYENAQQ